MGLPQPTVASLSGTSDASGNLTLKTRRGEPGQLHYLQLVAVRVTATSSVLAQIGIERAGLQLWLETLVMTTATYVYNYHRPVIVPSDYQVVVKFSSAGNKCLCEAWVLGSYVSAVDAYSAQCMPTR